MDYWLCCPRGAPGLPCLAWGNLLLIPLFVKAAPSSGYSVTPHTSSFLLPTPISPMLSGDILPTPWTSWCLHPWVLQAPQMPSPHTCFSLVSWRISRRAGKQSQENPFSGVIVVPLSPTVWKVRRPRRSLA